MKNTFSALGTRRSALGVWHLALVWLVLGAGPLAAQQVSGAGVGGRSGIGQSVGGRYHGLIEPRWGGPDTPEDSAYRAARETLNRGEYRRAADQFSNFVQKYPQSRYRPAALYWQSFSLYRAGTEADLRRALGLLDALQKEPTAPANVAEVNALVTRLLGTLAARGDASAEARLKDGASTGGVACDQEDVEVRGEALSALVQNDPPGSLPMLRRILARRDECSVGLRRRAIYLLGKDADPGRVEEILEVARTDPSAQVRSDAISCLAQIPGDRATAALERFLTAETDESSQRAVVRALRGRDDPTSARLIRRVIEREEFADALRIEAIRAVAVPPSSSGGGARPAVRGRPVVSDADAGLLKGVYERSKSAAIRGAIVETMARSTGPAADAWMLSLIRNPAEDVRLRATALNRLQRSETSVEDLGKLYDALTERQLRHSLVQILGQREEDAATDKLVEIVKTGTDPSVRSAAISALTRKKDPRSLKLLLEIVEK